MKTFSEILQKILVIVIAGALIVIVGAVLPIHSRVNLLTPTTLARQRIAYLGMELNLFADDHGGAFPRQLSEIPADESPNADEIRVFRPSRTSEKSQPWLYFPGHTVNDPPTTILAACPVTTDAENNQFWPNRQMRVIWTVAGRTDALTESEFKQRLKAQ